MEEFFAAILATIAEALLEIAGEALLELVIRLFASILESSTAAASLGVALLGIACGAMSLVIFPHPLVHPSRIHGISLVVSPILTGIAMAQVGRFLRKRDKRSIRTESFAYGFAFAFAMALIRFFFAK